ncbi:hypothetical protein NC653_035402 [Populus alba x Populus x berolinensis]|uniref:Uncharacterized protein n=1 Tax=Populus alba x Populus x berolinensis TaxID=444605 RepID=A0AAD6LPY0_9ROSI|nr:hypothetical protein NC653_035402 [Populus alba x Populus x berolinensis]
MERKVFLVMFLCLFLDMKLLLWMKLSTSRIHLMISTKPGRLGACSINCLMDMTSTMC